MIRFFDDNQAALAELNIDATLAALLRTSSMAMEFLPSF